MAFNLGDVRTAYIFTKNALQSAPFLLPAHLLLGKTCLQLGHGDRANKELLLADGLGAHRSLILIPLGRAYLLQDKATQLIAELVPLGNIAAEDAEVLVMLGEAHLQLGELYDARRAFAQALERDPRSLPGLLWRLRVLLQQGVTNDAAVAAGTVVAIAPYSGNAWYLKGVIARTQGNAGAALEDFNRAAERLPSLLPAQVGRIGILPELGRLGEAEDAVAAVRKVYPNDPRTLYLDAVAKGRRGSGTEAVQSLQAASGLLAQPPRELLDDRPPTLLLSGMVRYRLKAWDQANDSPSVCGVVPPRAVGSRVLLAQIALDWGQHEVAVKVLEPALVRSPGNQRVLSLLAEAHRREGQHLKASTLLQLAIEAGADTAVLRTQLAINEFGLGRQGEAIAELGAVFDIHPKLTSAGATLVVLLLKNHRYDEAVETAKRLVVEEGPNLTYVNLLGVAALAQGDLDLAGWAFDLVLTLDPAVLPAKLNLADLSLREGGASCARERLEAIVAAHPDNVSAMLLPARAQAVQGKAEEARRTAERAVTLDPKAVAPVMYLAELLLRMNEAPQALSVMDGIEARLPTIDDVKLLAIFSRVYLANGQRASAQTMLQKGSSLAGYDPRSLLTIADLQQGAGVLKGAAWSLERAVEGDPSFFPARIRLGEFAVAQGDLPKATEVAERLQRDFPDKPYGHHLLGTLRQKEGDDQGALEHRKAAPD